MKTPSVTASCCLLAIMVGTLPGCATRGHVETPAEEVARKEWEDRTPAQKMGYYLAWPAMFGLLWGASTAAESTSR